MEGSAVAAMSGPAPTEQPAPVAAEPVLAEQPAPAAEPVAAVAAAPVAPVASPDDAAIVEAIRGIVATGDLNVLTVKTVLAQLQTRFGVPLDDKKALIKTTTRDEAIKRQEAEAEDEPEEAEPVTKKRAKPASPEPRRRKNDADSASSNAGAQLDDVPTNVEVAMDPNDFVRRNPGRAGRRASAPPSKKKAPRKKAKTDEDGAAPAKKARGGFSKPVMVNDALAKVLGVETLLPRTQVVKALQAYIKEHNLKDPKDGRKIRFDDKLQAVFKAKTTTFFKLQKLISDRKLVYDPKDVVGGESYSDDDEEGDDEEGDDEEDGGGMTPAKTDTAPAAE